MMLWGKGFACPGGFFSMLLCVCRILDLQSPVDLSKKREVGNAGLELLRS